MRSGEHAPIQSRANTLSISKATLTTVDIECVRLGKRRLYDRFVLDRYADALSGVASAQHDYEAARRKPTPDEAYAKWKREGGVKG